jgi:pimeloyl-ACP methyl ester carboxylesterase
MQHSTHWHAYHPSDVVAWAEATVQPADIQSTGVPIHIDTYPNPGGPVVIVNHGGGGYCKLFAGVAKALHQRGYTVVLPDQRGQGFSGGARGDVTISQAVQNVIDAACWAEATFKQPIFISGGSLGSGIAYMAATQGAPHQAVACHNLYHFGPHGDALRFTRWPWLSPLSAGGAAVTRLSAQLMGDLRLPLRWFSKFEAMLDERDAEAASHWPSDPIPLRTVPLRYMASLANTPPAVPFEVNTSPVLVINPLRDEMVAPEVTRRNYERLSGRTHYVEIDYGHWSLLPAFNAEWAALVDDWFRQWLP